MTITISVGSGKGGVGKSTIIANLAVQLAKAGKRVCLVDLDIGGADDHILFGLFEPQRTLTHFLSREIESLTPAIHTFDSLYGLQLIPGTGDTLQTANMSYQEKQRVLRALNTIDTDILLLDVGAGTNYHVLDFFMFSDIQICVTLPEATAILDFYNFLQLATIRKALGSFLSQGEVSTTLKKNHFTSLAEVFELAEKTQNGSKEKAQQALRYFNPLLIINKVGDNGKLNTLKLHKMTSKYLGISLPSLGEIPEDKMIAQAARSFLPVAEYDATASASIALKEITEKLIKVTDLFLRKRQ